MTRQLVGLALARRSRSVLWGAGLSLQMVQWKRQPLQRYLVLPIRAVLSQRWAPAQTGMAGPGRLARCTSCTSPPCRRFAWAEDMSARLARAGAVQAAVGWRAVGCNSPLVFLPHREALSPTSAEGWSNPCTGNGSLGIFPKKSRTRRERERERERESLRGGGGGERVRDRRIILFNGRKLFSVPCNFSLAKIITQMGNAKKYDFSVSSKGDEKGRKMKRLRVPGSIPGWGVWRFFFFCFCRSYTFHFSFSFPFPFTLPLKLRLSGKAEGGRAVVQH